MPNEDFEKMMGDTEGVAITPPQDAPAEIFEDPGELAVGQAPEQPAASQSPEGQAEKEPLDQRTVERLNTLPWDEIRDTLGLTKESVLKYWEPRDIKALVYGRYTQPVRIFPKLPHRRKNDYQMVSLKLNVFRRGEKVIWDYDAQPVVYNRYRLDANGEPSSRLSSFGNTLYESRPVYVNFPTGTAFIINGKELSPEESDRLRITGALGRTVLEQNYYEKKVIGGNAMWFNIPKSRFDARRAEGEKSVDMNFAAGNAAPAQSDPDTTLRSVTKEVLVGVHPYSGQIIVTDVSAVAQSCKNMLDAAKARSGAEALSWQDYSSKEAYPISKEQLDALAHGRQVQLSNGSTKSWVYWDVFRDNIMPSADLKRVLNRERAEAAQVKAAIQAKKDLAAAPAAPQRSAGKKV